MSAYAKFLMYLPEVRSPQKKGSLKSRLFWTFSILVLFLFLAAIPLYGINSDQAQYFKTLELLLGAKIGKLMTLGIGPIVTASIVLQLFKGAGILKLETSSEHGRFVYNGTHKLLTFLFIIAEGIVYVAFGAVSPSDPSLFWIVALQMMAGGFIVFYLDDIVKKWGIGSGVSLFIAAGIGSAVFLQLFSPFTQEGVFAYGTGEAPIGKFWAFFYYLANPVAADSIFLNPMFTSVLGPVLVTVGLFFLIVFFQSINVEIPLSFGRVRGQSFKWPLNFFYSGVIPIILVSALAANLQLWARLLESVATRADASSVTRFISEHILGQFQGGSQPISGFISWIYPHDIWSNIGNLFSLDVWPKMLSYVLYLTIFATLFAYLWIQTSGLDARSQARNIINSGLQIPGFRKDERIIEKILDRYIVPLTLMGGAGIGLLAATADILAALTSGTGILLLIMVIYQFYQQLARESMEDFTLLKKLMRK